MAGISINYYGYFTPYGGYGIANLNWITYLTRAGIDVYPHNKFSYRLASKEREIIGQEQAAILDKPFVKQRIGVVETTPYDFYLNTSKFRIANTMIESSRMGKTWVNQCNAMDLIVVPNEFQKNAFIQSGVVCPIKIVRHGTWTEMFPYYERPERPVFTFGTVGYLNERKGVFDLIRAFSSEFALNEPVRLILKSSNQDFGYYSRFSDPRITTDISHLSPQDLNKVYQSFDCFVFPSRAEGVGQPPREAMSTGLPTIVTKYSGLEEIADLGYPLTDLTLKEGMNPQIIEQTGDWAYPDIQELMYQMRWVYEHQAEARQKGKESSRIIKEEHSWEKAATDMKTLLETI